METAPALFPNLLGLRAWRNLPETVRRMHGDTPRVFAQGVADVDGSSHPLARLLRRLLGLPPPGMQQAVDVCIERQGTRETWTRRFALGQMRSTLHADAQGKHLLERLGPITLRFALHPDAHGIPWHVDRAWLLGVRVPTAWLGKVMSRSGERQGRYAFDIDTQLPWIGRLVAYHGWLEIVADDG
ncbi:MAG TPA: DUF4166 domain-containing protein [Dyella sp.]|uniref:DUF4166 domain-containing protein n=1 Tax=Dyella sp. TaxID=1869338 RepID=UPI002BA79C3D|nr:DUF4166 domain-containing protein [Dyella sp.]HTV86294.1 DUF4166 domain-containing protein [Dyella sp.]